MTITDLKVYRPAKDFEVSKRFYRELGFTLTEAWGGTFFNKIAKASENSAVMVLALHSFMLEFLTGKNYELA